MGIGIIELQSNEDFDETCRPDVNNWIPCVCIPSYMIVMASLEIFIFLVCFIMFIGGIYKKGKQVDFKTVFLLVLFWLAFITHYVFLIHAYSGPDQCRAMHVATSFIFFLPQAIFFLVFIWAIFKLLLVWRGMEASSDEEAEQMRKRIRCFQLSYLMVWLTLWGTQRTAEAITIDVKRED